MLRTKILLLLVLWLGIGVVGVAQQNKWILKGVVVDTQQTPLVACLLFLTVDTTLVPLQFTNTDQSGKFQFEVETVPQLWLNVRYLGYDQVKRPVSSADSNGVVIMLSPSNIDLKEVVITESRPAIVEKSDTLRYNLKYFRDSTEYNIEDVLKKLPGIQISNNGAITINGKALGKVLVEGEDVFGKQYTIGTQNIRALMVETVEVIDHYQENAVLKEVKQSDEVVLNLKFNQDIKRALGGTVELGLGYGAEEKYSFQSNLFSLANKSKFLWLNNLGNTGSQYSPQELDATYGQDGNGFKLESPSKRHYLNPIGIKNPGLPSAFVNNARNNFSTIRSVFSWKNNWKLNLNGTFSLLNDQQYDGLEQELLFDPTTYRLMVDRQSKIKKLLWEGETQLTHISKDAKRSLFFYSKWASSQEQGGQAIVETLQQNIENYATTVNIQQRGLNVAGIFSQKIRENSVAQMQVNFFQDGNKQNFSSQNKAYATYWAVDSAFIDLSQNLKTPYREGNVFLRYLRAMKNLNFELETQYSATHAEFLPQLFLQEKSNVLPFFPIEVNATQSKRFQWQQSLKLNGSISNRDRYSLRVQRGDQKIQRSQQGTFRKPYVRVNASVEHLFSDGGKTALTYHYSTHPISAQAVFSAFYLADAYTLVRLLPQTKAAQGQNISFTYNRKDTDRFRFYFMTFRLGFNQDSWQDSLAFVNALQLTQPYYTQGNNSFTMLGRFEQFIPKLKLNLKFGTGYSASRQLIGAYGENLPLQVRIFNLNGDIIRSFGHHFKVDVYNKLESSRSYTTEIDAPNNYLFNWQLRITSIWQSKKWMAAFSFGQNFYKNNNQVSANLVTTSLKIRKSFAYGPNKRGNFVFDFYNLQNTQAFKTLQKSDYFLFASSVEAIPSFFVFKIDLPL